MKKFFALIALIIAFAVNATAQMYNKPAIDVIIFKANGVKLYCIKEGHSSEWYTKNCVAMGGDFSSDRFANEKDAERFADYLRTNKHSLELKHYVIIKDIETSGKFVKAEIYRKDTYWLEQQKRREHSLHFGNMTAHVFDGEHIEKIEYTIGDYTFSGTYYSHPTYESLLRDREALGGFVECYVSNDYEATTLMDFINNNKEKLEGRDNVVITGVTKGRYSVSMFIYEKNTYELQNQRLKEERNAIYDRLSSLNEAL